MVYFGSPWNTWSRLIRTHPAICFPVFSQSKSIDGATWAEVFRLDEAASCLASNLVYCEALLLRLQRNVEYCDKCVSVCASICLSVCEHTLACNHSYHIFCACCFWRRCDMLCISGFVDDVSLSYCRPTTSPYRCITAATSCTANAPAAWYMLHPILDENGH